MGHHKVFYSSLLEYRTILISQLSGGQFVKIGGVDCYVAVPDIDYNKTAVLLFLPDAFGVQLVNSQVCLIVH
jgi:hypothetical protein